MLTIIIPSDLCPRFQFSRFPLPSPSKEKKRQTRFSSRLSTSKLIWHRRKAHKFDCGTAFFLTQKRSASKLVFIIRHRWWIFTLHNFSSFHFNEFSSVFFCLPFLLPPIFSGKTLSKIKALSRLSDFMLFFSDERKFSGPFTPPNYQHQNHDTLTPASLLGRSNIVGS